MLTRAAQRRAAQRGDAPPEPPPPTVLSPTRHNRQQAPPPPSPPKRNTRTTRNASASSASSLAFPFEPLQAAVTSTSRGTNASTGSRARGVSRMPPPPPPQPTRKVAKAKQRTRSRPIPRQPTLFEDDSTASEDESEPRPPPPPPTRTRKGTKAKKESMKENIRMGLRSGSSSSLASTVSNASSVPSPKRTATKATRTAATATATSVTAPSDTSTTTKPRNAPLTRMLKVSVERLPEEQGKVGAAQPIKSQESQPQPIKSQGSQPISGEKGATVKGQEKPVEAETRALRPRGPDKKAWVPKPFLPHELDNIVPYAFAAQCRAVASGILAAVKESNDHHKLIDKKWENLVAMMEADRETLRLERVARAKGIAEKEAATSQQVKIQPAEEEEEDEVFHSNNNSADLFEDDEEVGHQDAEGEVKEQGKGSRPNSSVEKNEDQGPEGEVKGQGKRSKPDSSDVEDEEQFATATANSQASPDLFDDEADEKWPQGDRNAKGKYGKLHFDFVAAAEKEAVPVHPSKKFIMDGSSSPLPPIQPPKDNKTTQNKVLDETVNPNITYAADETYISHKGKAPTYAPDDTYLSHKGNATYAPDETYISHKGNASTYAPDDTYFTGNVTYVKCNKGTELGQEKPPHSKINETVTLPSGSTAKFGNHVPTFQDFNSSRHQAPVLEIVEEEEMDEDVVPDFAAPPTTTTTTKKGGMGKEKGPKFHTGSQPYPHHSLKKKEKSSDSGSEFLLPNKDSKDKDRSSSSSSSSSTASFKSAVSHLPTTGLFSLKKGTSGGSSTALPPAKELVHKLKKEKEEIAQRNKEENLKRKQELSKKKNEEWKLKMERMKQDQKKAAEAAAVGSKGLGATSTVTSGFFALSLFGKSGAPTVSASAPPKPHPLPKIQQNFGLPPPHPQTMGKASGPMKAYIKQPLLAYKPPVVPPISSYLNLEKKASHSDKTFTLNETPPATAPGGFKTPLKIANGSFLDASHGPDASMGPMNSYDITLFEDLDEDLKHRVNKKVPDWANNKMEIAAMLFKQIGCREVPGVGFPFPKVDPSFKLFPNHKS